MHKHIEIPGKRHSMKKTQHIWILLTSIIFILVVVVVILRHPSKPTVRPPGSGMMLAFEQIPQFKDAIILSTMVTGGSMPGEKPRSLALFRAADVTYGYLDMVSTIENNLPLDYYWRGFIAVTPDNSKFYVGTHKHLVEFDNDLSIRRKIPIS